MEGEKKIIRYTRIVDLSHEIHADIPLWPGDPKFLVENVASFEKNRYFLRKFSIGEHSATHMNAPSSFFEGARSIEQYPPDQLVMPAVVIDIRDKATVNPDYAFSIDDLLEWEKKHGKIPPGHMVILYTGWQNKASSPSQFINLNENGRPRFPGFLGECTKFLIEEREISGVGIDTHGVDPGFDESFETNTRILSNNGIVLECLTRLDQLPPTGTTLVIGILRLRQGSGSPVSVTAFVD